MSGRFRLFPHDRWTGELRPLATLLDCERPLCDTAAGLTGHGPMRRSATLSPTSGGIFQSPREQRNMSNKIVPVTVGILFASGFGVAKATRRRLRARPAMSAMGP